MRFAAIAFTVVCALSLQPPLVLAGTERDDDAYCSPGKTNNGVYTQGCMGTMRGFREAADPSAFAQLEYRANGTIYFSAQLNGVYFGCVMEDTYDAQYFATIFTAATQHGRFAIGAENGKCIMSGATLFIGSQWLSH